MKKEKNVSKILLNALHEKPETFDLQFDVDGFTNVDDLVSKLEAKGIKMSVNAIKRALEESKIKQFSTNKDGSKIRVNPWSDIDSNERR